MTSEVLDPAQLRALEASVQLVEAGPGAGKTRTIVERMKRHSSDTYKGIALISFTNTAADEAKIRCEPSDLAAPNYVGTVDSFLHKFVVTPAVSLASGVAPRYVTSWHELPESAALIRVRAVSGKGFRLGSFKVRADGRIEIGSSISPEDRQYLAACERAGKRTDLIAFGQERVEQFLKNNTFDSEAARRKALEVLSDEDSVVAKRLATRFDEIIIDEFQDCSDIEVKIIGKLKDLGINVVVIADPDQAIYEFRDASPESYREYRASLREAEIVLLETNYRSSPAICQLVAMLRSVGTGNMVSNRPELQNRIIVLAGSSEHQRANFATKLETVGISPDDAIVLAHQKKQARIVAGLSIENPAFMKSSHKTFRLLGSILAIRDAEGPQLRKSAIDQAQKIILGLFEWNFGEKGLVPAAQLEILEITRSHIASCLLEMLAESAKWVGAASATASIRNIVEAHFGDLSRRLPKLGRALVSLNEDHWRVWDETSGDDSPGETTLNCSHIHAVKGQEYKAVLLSVEKQRGKDGLWDMVRRGQTDESLRVLYVGASRAAELLALGCTAKEAASLTRALDNHQIEYELLKEEKT